MTSRTACGFVLKVADHAESDKLVTLYSRESGRISGIAKGAKKSKRRFVNKLELFSLLQLSYRVPQLAGGLIFIEEAEIVSSFISLRNKYRWYVAATYIIELVLCFSRDHDADQDLFALIHWAVHALEYNQHPGKVAALFHLKLLALSGYKPALEYCLGCQKIVSPGYSYTLLASRGSLLCNLCAPGVLRDQARLSVQTLKIMASGQRYSLAQLQRLNLQERTIAETLQSLHQYTLQLLQLDIRSWKSMYDVFCRHARSV